MGRDFTEHFLLQCPCDHDVKAILLQRIKEPKGEEINIGGSIDSTGK